MNKQTAINEARTLAQLAGRAMDVIQDSDGQYMTVACSDNVEHWPVVTVLGNGRVLGEHRHSIR